MSVQESELLKIFSLESAEFFRDVELNLLELEECADERRRELVQGILRGAHSLKSGSSFLGFGRISALAHEIETVLEMLREGEKKTGKDIIDTLLIAFDRLREMVVSPEESDGIDISDTLESLAAIISSGDGVSSSDSETEYVGYRRPESLRMDVRDLDTLMDVVTRMYTVRSVLLAGHEGMRHAEGPGIAEELNICASSVCEMIFRARKRPISEFFAVLPRLVRSLAKKLGKEVALRIIDEGVELDAVLLEGIGVLFSHLIRNALDHGIESPGERIARGKNPAGVLAIRAFREEDAVCLDVSDDGKGIDPDFIARRAVEKMLIAGEKTDLMTEIEKMNLVFLPGFSMTDEVTDVSGRGIGLYAVKTALNNMGADVFLSSETGVGTTFHFRFSSIRSFVNSLIVTLNGERFVLHERHVHELIRIPASMVKKRIELIGRTEVLIHKGEIIPLVGLDAVLGVKRTFTDPKDGIRKQCRRGRISDRRSRFTPALMEEYLALSLKPGVYDKSFIARRSPEDRRYRAASDVRIVVIVAGIYKYGLVVEEIHDLEETFVKPFETGDSSNLFFLGNAHTKDGNTAPILDVTSIASLSGISSMIKTPRAMELAAEYRNGAAGMSQAYLLFKSSTGPPAALPLSRVIELRSSDEVSPLELVSSFSPDICMELIAPLDANQDSKSDGGRIELRNYLVFAVFDGRRVIIGAQAIVDIVTMDVFPVAGEVEYRDTRYRIIAHVRNGHEKPSP